jgi:hypothetical protein
MSYQGIKLVANTLFQVQQARLELMRMGSADHTAKSGHQDIMLSHMLGDMEKSITDRFCKLTMEKIEPPLLKR